MVISLERGADATATHCLRVSCSSKIQISFTFLVPAHLGSPRQRAVKPVCIQVGMVHAAEKMSVCLSFFE